MRPMLAAKSTLEDIERILSITPLYACPKLDGIRAVVKDGTLYSRTLKPIRNAHTQALFGKSCYEGLDGELIIGEPTDKDVYINTNSGVMSFDGQPNVSYHVFDYHNLDGTYEQRLSALISKTQEENRLKLVPAMKIRAVEELLSIEKDTLQLGYEGLILRHPQAPYKFNRSTLREAGMIKFKRFADSEGKVVGYEPWYENQNAAQTNELGLTKRSSAQASLVQKEMLGALIIFDETNNWKVKVGTGFDMSQRAYLWGLKNELLGQIIKYKYFEPGIKDVARHPVFLGFRDKEDV